MAETQGTQGKYRPRFTLYKANGKGTGGAMQLELHPAHDQTDGSIWMKMARQMTIGDRRGPTPVYPRFDWENAITVKLDFSDLARMLQVFRGECEELEEGRGLFHASPVGSTKIVLRHLIGEIQGYSLEVYRTAAGSHAESQARVYLCPYEAIGIVAAIEGALSVICFGIPMIVERDTSAYRQEAKGLRNAPAA